MRQNENVKKSGRMNLISVDIGVTGIMVSMLLTILQIME